MSGAELFAVLGAGASIIQIIQACQKVKSRIQEYRKNVAFEDLSLRLSLFTKDLERIHDSSIHNINNGKIDEETQIILGRIVEGCHRQISALQTILDQLESDEKDSKAQRFWRSVQSVSKDRQIRQISRTLSEYSNSLTLHLVTRTTTTSVESQAAFSQPQPTLFEVPQKKVTTFVSRTQLLQQLKDSLSSKFAVAILTGLGGQGKSQLVLDYCEKNKSNYQVTFWINASTTESILSDLERLFEYLKSPSVKSGNWDREAKARWTLERTNVLEQNVLLIFDNWDDPAGFDISPLINLFKPNSSPGYYRHAIVTSRSHEACRLGKSVPVQGLSDAEGLELLLKQLNKTSPSVEETNAASAIIQRLGHLPLAIDQAGAYMSLRQLPVSSFMDHFEERRKRVLEHQPKVGWTYIREGTSNGLRDTTLSAFTTWELSFAAIAAEQPEERSTAIGQFLSVASNFNGAHIDERIFAKAFEVDSRLQSSSLASLFLKEGRWSRDAFQDLLVDLMSQSLVQSVTFDTFGTAFSLHPVVRDWLQLRQHEAVQRETFLGSIRMLAAFLQMTDSDSLLLKQRQQILSHVSSLNMRRERLLSTDMDKQQFGGFLDGFQTIFATFLGENDRWIQAERLFIETAKIQEASLGVFDLGTMATWNNLGSFYVQTPQHNEAEPILREVIRRKEQTLGLYHERTLNSVNNLANLYLTNNRLDEAKTLQNRVLTGYIAQHGEIHPKSRSSANNLGETFLKQNRLTEASELFGRALDARGSQTSTFPCDELHYHVLSNLALVAAQKYDPDQAIKLLTEVVKGRDAIWGEKHTLSRQARSQLEHIKAGAAGSMFNESPRQAPQSFVSFGIAMSNVAPMSFTQPQPQYNRGIGVPQSKHSFRSRRNSAEASPDFTLRGLPPNERYSEPFSGILRGKPPYESSYIPFLPVSSENMQPMSALSPSGGVQPNTSGHATSMSIGRSGEMDWEASP